MTPAVANPQFAISRIGAGGGLHPARTIVYESGSPARGPRGRPATLMSRSSRRDRTLLLRAGLCCGVWLLSLAGCSELRGRRRIREGNRLYREGQYAHALDEYRHAEALVPSLPLLWLNEGLTCRQLMVPGAKTPEAERAVDCALAAFTRLKQIAPGDARAEQLYVQTLFDGDRLTTLAARYTEQLKSNPADVAAVNGLIQVYSRWNRFDEALVWYQKKATLLPNDAEAQYAVGVFVWQQLFERGGGPDKASFDPRPGPADDAVTAPPTVRGKPGQPPPGKPLKQPPPFALGDITGASRAKLADLGIAYLERAVALRPRYRDAMVYLNLLYRQKSMAYFDQPEPWQAAVDAAERWRRQATDGSVKGEAAAPP